MEFQLKPQNGDSLAVPQLVLARLGETDGDTIRMALYLLQGGTIDPDAAAKTLHLKSPRIAKTAISYWAGAGLLERTEKPKLEPLPSYDTQRLNEAAMRDPMMQTISDEVQMQFGKPLGHTELMKLSALYQEQQYQPDVIMICAAHLAKQGKNTVGKLSVELSRWREAGVETGEDVDRYLLREEKRREREQEVAALFQLKAEDLTSAQCRAIHQWFESWGFGLPMVQEALVQADGKNTIRYVGGILRSWHAQGFTEPAQVRGSGNLQGNNIKTTTTAGKQYSTAIQSVFEQDWSKVFDED